MSRYFSWWEFLPVEELLKVYAICAMGEVIIPEVLDSISDYAKL